MARTFTHTLSLSIGGDVPTWEGEATVTYGVTWGRPAVAPAYGHGGLPADPDEVEDVTVTHIDGDPVATREPHEAEALQCHIECNDRLMGLLLERAYEAATEEAYDAADARYEARRDDALATGAQS